MDIPIPEDKLTAIREALFQGQKIQAIKLYRKCTGSGLAEAKAAVEKLETELRAASPENFTTPAPGKGCSGVLVGVCAVVVAVILWIVSR
jgi:hypothetical protein